MKAAFFIIGIFITNLLFSANYFVATTGNNANDGLTLDKPFASIESAISRAVAGDVIWVRGGTYKHSSTISISKSGSQTDTIFMLAYENEKPVLDFSGTAFGKKGISLSGNYWKIKGFEEKFAGDNGLGISGSYNTIDQCSFHDNKDTGLQLNGGAHNNKIINCDSYYNADPTDYGDADGFAAKMDVGSNNYFYGCRAWLNVDDGWDGYLRGADDVSTVLENCWTWSNGYFKNGTDGGASANGNGFKVGGSDNKLLKHNFTLVNCLSFYNKAKGFDQNSNIGDIYFYNCTAYGNLGNNYYLTKELASGKKAEIKNCVLFNGKNSLADFVVQASNSWNAPFTVTASDFVSVDTTGISGPRQPNGSLPNVAFMHLASGSDLINAGTDLGYPFNGSAPDLGAFETSATSVFEKQEALSIFKAFQNSNKNITLIYNQENVDNATVSIFSITGGRVYAHQLSSLTIGKNKAILPVSLRKGIYFLSINSYDKSFTTKISIE